MQREESAYRSTHRGDRIDIAPLVARTEAPRNVSVEEHEAPLHRVRELVETGALSGRDLIDVGRGWESIADCFEVSEAIETRKDERKRRLRIVVALAALVLGLLALWALS